MDTALDERNGGESSRQMQMEAIVIEHETGLLRYATRLVNNPTTAEDVVQNVFIKLFRGWKEGMHPARNLKSWLYRVTHNEAIDFIRRESRLQVLHEKQAVAVAEDCPNGVNCANSDEERREMVMAELRKLHPREQQVVLLRLEEGLSYAEISEVTGRSEGNVGSILHNAVLKLARSLRGVR